MSQAGIETAMGSGAAPSGADRAGSPGAGGGDRLRPPLPTRLQVEVTAACNLACRMCIVAYRPPQSRVRATMTLARFEALLDEAPETREVVLQGIGEPLLCPDLVAMVRAAAARGIATGFNTNATLLTERKSRELVRAGLDWVCVSLDGATAETFEAIRHGARFARVVENLEALLRVRRSLASATPRVRVVFVAMRRNVHELPDVVQIAGRLGADECSVQNLSHSFDDVAADPAYRAIAAYARDEALWDPSAEPRVREAWAAARTVAAEHGLRLRLPPLDADAKADAVSARPGAAGCDWPWSGAYVQHDGTVQPCCMIMGTGRAVLGNLATAPFAAVWHAAPYREFRRRLLVGPPPEVCEGCAYYRGAF